MGGAPTICRSSSRPSTTAIETTVAAKTEHRIPGPLLEKKVRVSVVGCGGTGSAIAAGLPYLHQAMVALGHPYGLHVVLVDGDRISRTNCVRQPFSESEIGLYKATVLATRINLFWGLGWKGVPHFVDENWGHETDILVGCVDSRAARNAMNQALAYQALAMLARLFRYGRLSYHGGFVSLGTGRTTSLAVDLVLWQRMRTQSADSEYAENRRRKGGYTMSQSFRPVKEIWNTHSSCFVEPGELITLFHDLAARVGTASDEHNYGDNMSVWFENGRNVLDYIQSDNRFRADSFKDSLAEQGVLVDDDALVPLLANMQSLAEQWRESIGEHGELVFYVDNC